MKKVELKMNVDETGLWDYTEMPPCPGRAKFTPHTATHIELDESLG
jgi:hypothetical protein